MGIVSDLLGGDNSYSSSTVSTPPSNLIPEPNLTGLVRKDQKKIMKQWLAANERIALYNNMDRLLEAITFTTLFLGQMGLYSQLDLFKKDTEKTVLTTTMDPILGPVIVRKKVKSREPDWVRVCATSGIVTALSYMAKDNPAGFGIPAGSLMGLVAIEGIGDIFQMW